MSSNDALSRMEELLDKLGMDYGWDSDTLYWDGSDGVPWTAERRVDGDLNLYSPHCTFKQAVAATLGIGTCPNSDGTRPNGDRTCPDGNEGLERSKNGVTEYKPIKAHECLSGTDCPASLCPVCGELFEEGAHFCSNCGAKMADETIDGVAETCVFDDYTAKVMAELVQVMEERDTLLSKFKLSQEMRRGEHEQYSKENAKLREQLDWERSENGWMREFNDRMAEHCGTKDCPSLVAYVNKIETENAKLRQMVRISIVNCNAGFCDECPIRGDDGYCPFAEMAQELGVEVD